MTQLTSRNPWNWLQRGDERNELAPYGFANPLSRLQRDMDRLFDETFREFGRQSSGPQQGALQSFRPSLDISANDKAYKVVADLPGVAEQDVKLDLSPDGILTISGERRQESKDEDKERNYLRIERSYGSFTRQLQLPDEVDRDAIEANYDNGVLTLTLPKRELPKAQQPRQIAINAGKSQRKEQSPKKAA